MIKILIGRGFEEIEALTVFDILKRGKLDAELVSVTGSLKVNSASNMTVVCDCLLEERDNSKEKMVVIPGGMGGVKRILASPSAKEYITKSFEEGKYIGAICAGPLVLDKLKILEGYKFTCYPGVEKEMENTHIKEYYMGDKSLIADRNLITSVGPGSASEFAFKLLELLAGKEEADKVYNNWWGILDDKD